MTADNEQRSDSSQKQGDTSERSQRFSPPSTQRASHDQGSRYGQSVTSSRGGPSSASREMSSEGKGKFLDAMNGLADSIDALSREVSKGSKADLSGVQQKLSKAREAISSCGCASKQEEGEALDAEGEGFGASKGQQSGGI